jgi:hypothetical protein
MKINQTQTYKNLKDAKKDNFPQMPQMIIIKSKGKEVEVLIDPDDYETVSKYKWFIKHNNYVYTQVNRKTVHLHRLIINAPKGLEVDHINRNPLDNRKQNLRLCTKSQNNMNKEGIRGVSKFRDKWRARIKKDGKELHLGVFDTFNEALEKRKEFEIIMFNEFANI